jgi:hypothetical protein
LRKTYAGTKGKMTAQTHSCDPNTTGAVGEGEEVVDCFEDVFVVGF